MGVHVVRVGDVGVLVTDVGGGDVGVHVVRIGVHVVRVGDVGVGDVGVGCRSLAEVMCRLPCGCPVTEMAKMSSISPSGPWSRG